MMKHCVVWSGGMDSTLILYDLVQKGIDVETIVFETDVFGYKKREYEDHARLEVMKYLKKQIPIKKIKLDFGASRVLGYNGGLFQQPAMISLTSVFGDDNTVYYFGYHKGDDFFTYQYHLLTAADHLLKTLGNKNIKFSFPLQHATKSDIVTSLQAKGLDKICHFCEYPEHDYTGQGFCGNCTPCKTYKDALELIDIYKRNNRSNEAYLFYEYADTFPKIEILKCEKGEDVLATPDEG